MGTALLEGWLKEDFHFTPYAIISYLIPGPQAELQSRLTLKVELWRCLDGTEDRS